MFHPTTLRRIFLTILLVLLSTSQASIVSAGTNIWTSNGPGGGTVYILAIDPATPATLYAGTPNGVLKSTNGGSWSSINVGLPTDISVYSLAIDPVTPTTLYAGTGGGVFKSTNGGESWNVASTGLTDTYVNALVIDPKTPATLYVGTASGVFKSTDGGGNWRGMNTSLTDGIAALVIDPLTPATLYAGTGGGVFKSTDGGENWSEVFTDLKYTIVLSLAIDPVTPTTLYAAAVSDDVLQMSISGVFKSTDGGKNWTGPILTIGGDYYSTGNIYYLAIDPVTPTTLYAARDYWYDPPFPNIENRDMLKSIDGGENWDAFINDGGVNNLAFDPKEPFTLYAGTDSGVFKSTDGGGIWNDINAGLPGIGVISLAIDPKTPATLYAGTRAGVFKSTDSGGSWRLANNGLKFVGTSLPVFSLAIDPATPTTLYAGSDAVGVDFAGPGLYKTMNSGGNWSEGSLWGYTDFYVFSLAIDPAAPDTLYAGTSQGVFKSKDGGDDWSVVSTGLPNYAAVNSLAIDPQITATLYAVMDSGVFKSTDGGKNWGIVSTGLPHSVVHSIAIDPKMTATLYAGMDSGVFKSTDGGKNWGIVSMGLPHSVVHSLAIDPAAPTTLYAGTEFGVFKSTNGGGNWSAFNAGLPKDISVNALAIDPSTPSTLYAGTWDGVFAIQQIPHALAINFPKGAPGSTFTITGSNFPPDHTTTMAINGKVLGTIQTDSSGGLVFYLQTNPTAEEGLYLITAPEYPGAMAQFFLDGGVVVRPQEGRGTVFVVPDGIAFHYSAYFPLTRK